jgi:hypothetical protein
MLSSEYIYSVKTIALWEEKEGGEEGYEHISCQIMEIIFPTNYLFFISLPLSFSKTLFHLLSSLSQEMCLF